MSLIMVLLQELHQCISVFNVPCIVNNSSKKKLKKTLKSFGGNNKSNNVITYLHNHTQAML